ncbi:MAG: histidine--tRNA ligase [Gammaproteobacteria bacterium]|nr:MAG: histidine--tRNA ligase [Gammaproteobacteria bacterium]
MNDLLPETLGTWRYLESKIIQIVESYGFDEIRLPIMERTELFKRSIGEGTDIVEKEMYTFDDRNQESITLRPEATASMVRAGITNGLLHNQKQKMWTMGPMFRYEKPQKGRYRQFYQFNIEAMGYAGPDIDAELIILCARMWKVLRIKNLSLKINSLGNKNTRAKYREDLINYFSDNLDNLDENSKNRLHSNPLRILDSKNPEMKKLIDEAPILLDYLDSESEEHFNKLKNILSDAGIDFQVNPKLVRGLDYYNRTVFEWETDVLGSQGAVCSGGRYDDLIEKIGGKSTPAIGWAMGMERLVSLYEYSNEKINKISPHIYIAIDGDEAQKKAFQISEELRELNPKIRIQLNMGGGSFKSQLKRADKSNSNYAIIIGLDELKNDYLSLKSLRRNQEQVKIPFSKINELTNIIFD